MRTTDGRPYDDAVRHKCRILQNVQLLNGLCFFVERPATGRHECRPLQFLCNVLSIKKAAGYPVAFFGDSVEIAAGRIQIVITRRVRPMSDLTW